jgi:hypothetical protein
LHGRIEAAAAPSSAPRSTVRLSYVTRRRNWTRAIEAIRKRQFSSQHPRDAATIAMLVVCHALLTRIESSGEPLVEWRVGLEDGEQDVIAWLDEILTGELRGSRAASRALSGEADVG